MKKVFLSFVLLVLSMAVFAQRETTLYWPEPTPGLYSNRNHVTYQVKIDGVSQASDNIEVAAFIDDECRGTIRLIEPYPVGLPNEYYTYLTVFGNTSDIGKDITFKAYDHATSTEYTICDLTLQFNGAEEFEFGGVNEGYYMEFESDPSFGPDYPWTPSTSYQGNGMALQAQIQIDGVPVNRASWEVGAFCGDECRGDVTPLNDWTDLNMGYFASMNIKGNDGDVISFYLYDKQAGKVFQGGCPTTVVLENDTYIGEDPFHNLFVLNFLSTPFFTLDIDAYAGGGGYYLIASPIGEVAPVDVAEMTSNTFDLYRFNQSTDKEWENYKETEGDHFHFNLESGRGYLYANSTNVRLIFTGTPYEGEGEVALTYDADAALKGWNLVGNPYATAANVDKSFYIINPEGRDEVIASEGTSVEAMEGIFVLAESEGESITFEPQVSSKVSEQLVVSLKGNSRGNTIDRAIVRFDNSKMLPKFQLFEGNTKLYILQNGKDYAVVNAGTQGEMPINFKAESNGTYSLSFSTENVEFGYLHLIDNLTGNDVDLLATSSYTFDAKTSDYDSRFKLVFVANHNDALIGSETFTFYSNGSWFIANEGEATLQIVDVNGRILSSEQINGNATKHFEAAAGVYVVRLINGNDVKTQKIVVE